MVADASKPRAALAGERIERIAVFRALVLGDMLCATPALRAIKAAWPHAELTLIGLPWAREWALRLPTVDRFEAFPGIAGLPEREPDPGAWPDFVARMRAERFDLLVQLHGSGSVVNEMLAGLGARRVAGFADPGDFCAEPALHTVWPRRGHEIERLLHLTDHLGLPRRGADFGHRLDFDVTDADRAALRRAVPELDGPELDGPDVDGPDIGAGGPIVCVHPGAQLPSRRWMPERFAAVADVMADALEAATARGAPRIVLTGTAAERGVVAEVARRLRHPSIDLAGRTDLFTLGALVERARLVVCNDTGVLHVAAALGTPSVAVSSGADVARWAPLDTTRHRVLWHDVPCRPCAHRVCPTGHECARGVGVGEVASVALGLLARPRRARGPNPAAAPV